MLMILNISFTLINDWGGYFNLFDLHLHKFSKKDITSSYDREKRN